MEHIIHVVMLGLVEGITEFLPVSSTAHLLLTEKFLGFQDTSQLFTVVIQFGAILAALWYFRADIVALFRGVKQRESRSLAFLRVIAIGLAPALVIGFFVELLASIPDNLTLIACTLIAGGIALLMLERWLGKKRLPAKNRAIDYASITPDKALKIGLVQSLAIIPGVSRSGATIAGGLLLGLNRRTATAFSFFLSVPIMFAASSLKLLKDGDQLSALEGGVASLLLGMAVALVSAFVVVKWLLRYVQTHTFRPFAYYRIILGLVLLGGLYLTSPL
jgi:undecaprenyl-diphosphatase